MRGPGICACIHTSHPPTPHCNVSDHYMEATADIEQLAWRKGIKCMEN